MRRPEADASAQQESQQAQEELPAAAMAVAQEEDNHEEKTQVASIMRSMSWVRCGRVGSHTCLSCSLTLATLQSSQGSALNHQGQGDGCAPEHLCTSSAVSTGSLQEADLAAQQQRLMDELHHRASAQAALAVGLSPSAAMAAMPLLPDMQDDAQSSFAMASMAAMVRRRFAPRSMGTCG
jgi:hypothetical protein